MKTPKSAKDIEPNFESDVLEDYPHPRFASQIFGHERAEQEILAAYKSCRMPQAWIFGGPIGIGKASLAWRLARFIMVHGDAQSAAVQQAQNLDVDSDHPIVHRIASMSHGDLSVLRRAYNDKTKRFFTEIRVEDVRKALEKFHRSAGEGGWRIAIIDCADDLNKSSANALLKVIEEPPPRSLFLIIAHQPARILPTIRSRARLLSLAPLKPEHVTAALHKLLLPHHLKEAEVARAAALAHGSVREALRLLDGSGLDIAIRLEKILSRMPQVDWAGVYDLSDLVCARDADDDFSSTITGIYDWLAQQIDRQINAPAAHLAPLAHVWEKMAHAVRHAEALNLDKRALLLSIFNDLSTACAAQRHQ